MGSEIASLLADNADAVGRYVGGKRAAVAVEDTAAWWNKEALVAPIVLGLKLVSRPLLHLELVETAAERTK
jgi:hypothetical protein